MTCILFVCSSTALKEAWRSKYDMRFDVYIRDPASIFLHATFLDPRFKTDDIITETRFMAGSIVIDPSDAVNDQDELIATSSISHIESRDAVFDEVLKAVHKLHERYAYSC